MQTRAPPTSCSWCFLASGLPLMIVVDLRPADGQRSASIARLAPGVPKGGVSYAQRPWHVMPAQFIHAGLPLFVSLTPRPLRGIMHAGGAQPLLSMALHHWSPARVQ